VARMLRIWSGGFPFHGSSPYFGLRDCQVTLVSKTGLIEIVSGQ